MMLQTKTLEIRVRKINSRLLESHNYCKTSCLWDMSLCSPPELMFCLGQSSVLLSSALSGVLQDVQMYVRA